MNKFLSLIALVIVVLASACASSPYAGGGYGGGNTYRRAFPRQALPGFGNPNLTRAYGSVCTKELPGRCIRAIDQVRHRNDEPAYQYACGARGGPLDGAYGTVTVPVGGAMLQCLDLTTTEQAFFPGVKTSDSVSLIYVGVDYETGAYKAYRKVTCGANFHNDQAATLC